MDINNIENEEPLSLNQYLLNRQKRKGEGKVVFDFIEYVEGGKVIHRIDFDEQYKSIVDKTTDEQATTNKP